MKNFPLPVVAFGEGSQPVEEEAQYMAMPKGMNSFQMPPVPEQVDDDVREVTALIHRLVGMMEKYPYGNSAYPFVDLAEARSSVVTLINDSLGQGEVSVIASNPMALRVQETAFAGVWRVRHSGRDGELDYDCLEACAIPRAVREAALANTVRRIDLPVSTPEMMSAPAILTEILNAAESCREGSPAHIINLTLSPLTPADLDCLVDTLGPGTTVILSRGYGNCRISSTGVANVWWVQYFNSGEQMILNTIEVVSVPEAAVAAEEDFRDSTERLREWLLAVAE
jgi:hydrogenase-1 operon protein HyaF